MNFQKKVTKNNYIRETIRVLNGLLDLTPREIDVLLVMMKIDIAWQAKTPMDQKNLMSTDNRRLIFKECNMAKSNFNKITKKLMAMKILVQSQDGRWIINELLKPTITKVKDKNLIKIKFILEVEDVI